MNATPAPLWRTLLYILLPTLGVLLLIGAFVFALSGRSGPVDQSATEPAGSSLSVQIPNAEVTLEPSTDDRVHVRMTGSFFGNEPTLTVRTDGGVTEVRGVMSDGHGDAGVCKRPGIPGGLEVRSGHRHATIMKHLGDATHPGSADADEVRVCGFAHRVSFRVLAAPSASATTRSVASRRARAAEA